MKSNSIEEEEEEEEEEEGGADGNANSRKMMVLCRSVEDIISNLPGNIIDNILICLPIRDAARTCVLSRTWRYKWLSIPQLVFDSDEDVFFRSISPTSPKRIWSRIYQILLRHDGPLHKLHLSVDEQMENAYIILDQIIVLLTGKDIQEFSLYPPNMCTINAISRFLPINRTCYQIPSTLFSCTHLSHLNIKNCTFRLPPEYTGFSKLVSVQLDYVYFTANDFETFLSKCPLVQRLKLQGCEETSATNHIEIDAPNLMFFYFKCPDLSFSFKNVLVLSTLIIKEFYKTSGPPSSNVKILGSLAAIEYFSACRDFLMDLTSSIVPEGLPVMLSQLKCVELCGLDFNSLKDLQFALLVISSSPNLCKLKIQLYDECEYDSDAENVPIKSLCLIEAFFDELRDVMMEDFTGTVREWEFIEFLLAKSLVLKKIIIQSRKGISEKKVVAILKAVRQYRSTSTKAQIIFLDSAKVESVWCKSV